MSRLLRGASIPVGLHGPVGQVAFQQSNEGFPLDDVVAWEHADPPAVAPAIQVQVKRAVKVTARDREFIKVVTAAVAACSGQPELITSRRLLFGLAARRSSEDHLDELTELTTWARAHAETEKFDHLFREGVIGEQLRDRYSAVLEAFATAVGASNATAVKALAHHTLRVLHVWLVEEGPDGRDWRTELDGLADLAAEAGKTPADIMAHLRSIAAQFGPRSGNVDAGHVRAELVRFQVHLPAGSTRVGRSAPHTTVNASGQSTVFNSQVMSFGTLNFHGKPPVSGNESETS